MWQCLALEQLAPARTSNHDDLFPPVRLHSAPLPARPTCTCVSRAHTDLALHARAPSRFLHASHAQHTNLLLKYPYATLAKYV
jgi:hypothetical protein